MAVFPRFFMFFLSQSCSESLAIPTPFNEHLKDPLPPTAILQGNGGRVWTVSWKKIRETVYFTDGWSRFAEDHELKNGEFLTFFYDLHRNFEVSVYNLWGVKEIRAVAEIVELPDSDDEEDHSSFRANEGISLSVDSLGSEETETGDSDNEEDDSIFRENEEISLSVDSLGSEETETETGVAPVVASSSNLDLMNGNPCFETYLKNRIYELLVPANVVQKHQLRFGNTINFIDGEGTLIGKQGKWADDRVCFKGWGRICRRNRLRDVDTVKCELLHVEKQVHSIKVHVIRGPA